MNGKVDLSIKDIYKLLCPDCQAKLRDLVKSKMADQMLDRALSGKGPEEETDAHHG